jgi:hypothetical protein
MFQCAGAIAEHGASFHYCCAIFGLSVFVFDNPNRVAYKAEPLHVGEGVELVTSDYDSPQNGGPEKRYTTRITTARGQPVIDPPATPWSIKEVALFAARLNVPIISLGIEDTVQPRGFRWKVFSIGVIAANWVIWPLLIGSMSGLIRKRN